MSTINLLPKDYVERRWRRRANWLCLILFFLVMAGVLGAQVVSECSARHARQVLRRVDADYAEAAKLIEQMQRLEAQERASRTSAELTASLIERVPRSTVLAAITQALPEHASLLSVELQMQRIVRGPAPASGKGRTKFDALSGKPAPDPARASLVMEITGLASTDIEVGRLIANLARNPLIASVDLVYSQEKLIDQTPVREFQVKAELKPDADAIDLAAAARGVPTAPPAAPGGPQARRPT